MSLTSSYWVEVYSNKWNWRRIKTCRQDLQQNKQINSGKLLTNIKRLPPQALCLGLTLCPELPSMSTLCFFFCNLVLCDFVSFAAILVSDFVCVCFVAYDMLCGCVCFFLQFCCDLNCHFCCNLVCDFFVVFCCNPDCNFVLLRA